MEVSAVDRSRPGSRRQGHPVVAVVAESLRLPAVAEVVVEVAPPRRLPSVAEVVEVARLQQPKPAVVGAAAVAAQFQLPVVEQEEVLARLRLLAWRAICVHILHILPYGL